MILKGVLAAKASFRRARALGRWFGATSGIPRGSRLSRLLVLLTAHLNGLSHCIWVWFKSRNHFLWKFLLDQFLNVFQHLVLIHAD